jgi:hypothetical protein
MANDYEKAKVPGQHQRIRDLEEQGCVSGIAGKIPMPYRVPLIEQFQKQRCHLVERLERVDRLLKILSVHPEFEAYQDFQELLRQDGY